MRRCLCVRGHGVQPGARPGGRGSALGGCPAECWAGSGWMEPEVGAGPRRLCYGWGYWLEPKVLLGADEWTRMGPAQVGWGESRLFLWMGQVCGLGQNPPFYEGRRQETYRMGLWARAESSLLLGAVPGQWGGVTVLLNMRDKTKEQGQGLRRWSPAFCYG